MYLEPETKRDIIHRLRSISKQCIGLENMFNENRDAWDIYIQFRAAGGAIKNVSFLFLDDAVRKDIIIRLTTPLTPKTTPPQTLEWRNSIMLQFHQYTRDKLPGILRELKRIETFH